MASVESHADDLFAEIMAFSGVTRQNIFKSLDPIVNRKNVFKAG